jgi:farnesol dehydrogenase
MKVLITGATGFIGANLANRLIREGFTVHALYRSTEKTKILEKSNRVLFKGDILDVASLEAAMTGCARVYHMAAFTDVWTGTPGLVYRLNVTGTKNVLEVAKKLAIKEIVFTSTAGVFGPSTQGIIREDTRRSMPFFLEYEKTKAEAEELVQEYVKEGMNIRIVNPTRVYGPGVLSKSNSVSRMIDAYSRGKWHLIPGNGKSIGNYVFVDDVVNGHILAMEKGRAGERYLLGGENIDYNGFFDTLSQLTGRSTWMIRLPLWLMLTVAQLAMVNTWLTGIKPFITPALVRKFNYHWNVSSQKAADQLGYSVTPIREGMEKTLAWIHQNKS